MKNKVLSIVLIVAIMGLLFNLWPVNSQWAQVASQSFLWGLIIVLVLMGLRETENLVNRRALKLLDHAGHALRTAESASHMLRIDATTPAVKESHLLDSTSYAILASSIEQFIKEQK